jgi:hypothetical protein
MEGAAIQASTKTLAKIGLINDYEKTLGVLGSATKAYTGSRYDGKNFLKNEKH